MSETNNKTIGIPEVLASLRDDLDKAQAGSRYFCESLFWASQPKQAAKT